MQTPKVYTPAPGEVFLWSILAQYERQVFDHGADCVPFRAGKREFEKAKLQSPGQGR